MQAGAKILGAKNGRTEINDLEHKKGKHNNLVDYSDGSHTAVGVATQHNSIHGAQHHDEQGFYKDGGSKLCKPLFQAFLMYHFVCV